jgi:hypothetical protein
MSRTSHPSTIAALSPVSSVALRSYLVKMPFPRYILNIANKSSGSPIRYCKSPPTNDREIAFPGSGRLSYADVEEGGVCGAVQGCYTAAGGMDVYGLDVRQSSSPDGSHTSLC